MYLLHKATLLIKRHKIERGEDLEWILKKFGTFNSLDFSSLPLTNIINIHLFSRWLILTKWLYFKSQFPEPEDASLRKIFDIADNPTSNKDDILKHIHTLTQWKLDDLETLDSGWQLQHSIQSDYTDIDTYLKLQESFKLVKLTGTSASTLMRWSKRDDNINDAQFITAQEIIQTAKSKYDYRVWLSKVLPLQDELREKKRAALVSFLIENSMRNELKGIDFNGKTYPNPKYWTSPSDLLGYFLIDVEMNACQLTSRTKQLMSSIQMFVPRCFLNLEQPLIEVSREEREDVVSINSWKQWEHIKSYNFWRAHLTIFLYPENVLRPELIRKEDKSPFFIELEDEILQKDITSENVEAALSNYLQKVLEISKLEIVGIYHELDDDNKYDGLPARINFIHVIERTLSQPAVYYYRKFDLNYNKWYACEKINCDIISNHVIPVVYNRKLYIFWLIFTEKTQDVKRQPAAGPTDSNSSSQESPKMLEIQVAWSTRNDRGWTSKKVSHQKLIHPWERPPSSYNLKPRYDERENLLWLDIFISTSKEFNTNKFYDPYSGYTKAFYKIQPL